MARFMLNNRNLQQSEAKELCQNHRRFIAVSY